MQWKQKYEKVHNLWSTLHCHCVMGLFCSSKFF